MHSIIAIIKIVFFVGICNLWAAVLFLWPIWAIEPILAADNITDTSNNISTRMMVGSQAGSLRFVGYASSGAIVYFKENGSVIGTITADSSGYFDKTISGLSESIHNIGLYAADTDSVLTLTVTYGVSVSANVTTLVSGIVLPPTFSLVVASVKRPAELIGSGRALNNATVQVFIQGSGDSQSVNTSTDNEGRWSVNINPKLHLGSKSAYAIALNTSGSQSQSSQTQSYEVLLSADINVDNLINLTDFSVLMYNYGTDSPANAAADINDNGRVDLVDFSVMMYYWSGG